MSWIKNLRAETDLIIKNSFPELANKKIFLLSLNVGPYWGISLWLLPFVRLIVISKKAKNIPPLALTGLIAHELSHQVIYQQKSWLRYIIRTPLIYLCSKKTVGKEERQVDRLVMDRGFGNNLYLLTKIIDQDPSHEKIKKHYFTPDEIEIYCRANKINF